MDRNLALWPNSVLSGQSVRRPCYLSHWLKRTAHKLVRISLRLVNRASLASNWKFNTSLLEIWDFRWRKPNSAGVSGGGYWE